ncbi:MAG: hypothetical protein OET07_10000 [Desulfobacteraceae bacterium]|jgi:hypothetical protein|nr:hypothetical protein [Desulfobacteraceae bacterium]MDH3722893.1 hypothetical protein [Desulfobacteraceae bacterium]MDH3838455.1 hypothetical protein [Desulfobacteraceae bacterium]MDH3874473.1 hypothetical protein [Desulfobacteraceae bacterium]
MEQTFIKSIELSNGLKLDFYDISRKLAGDRWYVGLIARIDIPLIDSLLTNQHLSHYSVEEISNTLGESVRFQQKRERHYIDEREKDDLLKDLMDSFIKRTLNYLSLPDFPGKYILKEFQTYRKQKTWYQNV